MKKDIHPKYHEKAKISCACGNNFVVGSTVPEIKVELCSSCHPFYTGKQKLVDTARRVEKFHAKMDKKSKVSAIRKGKKVKRAAQAKKRAKKEVTVKATPAPITALKDKAKVKKVSPSHAPLVESHSRGQTHSGAGKKKNPPASGKK